MCGISGPLRTIRVNCPGTVKPMKMLIKIEKYIVCIPHV